MSRSLKAHILLVTITFIWGATFVLIKDALADISPLFFNAVRMSLAGVGLLLVFRREMANLTRGALRAGVIVGIFLWLGFEFQTTGLRLTTPSKSAFLTGVSVVLVPVFWAVGWRCLVNRSIFQGRRLSSGRHLWTALGVACALLGLYLLAIPASHGNGLNLAAINRGDLLTLGCAVAFALQIIAMGLATSKYPFQQIATLETLVCAVLAFATVPVIEKTHAVWSPLVVVAIVITGLLGTAAAFTVQAWAQQFTPPTHTALIFSLEPVFAWITSYILLGERLGARATTGAALILGGVLISEFKTNQKRTNSV